MVRFSLIQGEASWRPDANSAWQEAEVNLPVNQGAQVWVADNGKAELQFDDGSFMRLRGGTLAILQTLSSDANGEYTEIQMVSGSAFFQIINPHSVYQIDTPQTTAKTSGPATIRVGTNNLSSICVHVGLVQVHAPGGSFTMHPHEYVSIPPAPVTQSEPVSYQVQPLPNPDAWDQWNNQREYSLDSYSAEVPEGALPSNIALASPGLDQYGDWQYIPHYGRCWHPHEGYGWRPYRSGHWVACQPYGWTWVSYEDWGWAPYHYGTWVNYGDGWFWDPGPAQQYWSPAVVHFCNYGDQVAWCPLAPEEVHYPSALSVGVFGNSWSLSFSIGGCAVYLADSDGVCDPQPWGWAELNDYHYDPGYWNQNYGYDPGYGGGYGVDHNFVPRNERFGGAISATGGRFGTASTYQNLAPAVAANYFQHAQPNRFRQGRPVFGPTAVRPAAAPRAGSFSRAAAPAAAVLARHTFDPRTNPRAAQPAVLTRGEEKPNHAAGAGHVNAAAANHAEANHAEANHPEANHANAAAHPVGHPALSVPPTALDQRAKMAAASHAEAHGAAGAHPAGATHFTPGAKHIAAAAAVGAAGAAALAAAHHAHAASAGAGAHGKMAAATRTAAAKSAHAHALPAAYKAAAGPAKMAAAPRHAASAKPRAAAPIHRAAARPAVVRHVAAAPRHVAAAPRRAAAASRRAAAPRRVSAPRRAAAAPRRAAPRRSAPAPRHFSAPRPRPEPRESAPRPRPESRPSGGGGGHGGGGGDHGGGDHGGGGHGGGGGGHGGGGGGGHDHHH